jgi:hypothetical protein
MKTTLSLVVLAALALPLGASARDDRLKFSVADALATPAAKAKLDPNVKLLFGTKTAAPGQKVIREAAVSRKTNAVGKSDQEACEWVFLSVAIELQEQARKAGGDAVVAIQSNYKHELVDSPTEFVCGAGSLMSGVAVRGQIVKLSGAAAGEKAAAAADKK